VALRLQSPCQRHHLLRTLGLCYENRQILPRLAIVGMAQICSHIESDIHVSGSHTPTNSSPTTPRSSITDILRRAFGRSSTGAHEDELPVHGALADVVSARYWA